MLLFSPTQPPYFLYDLDHHHDRHPIFSHPSGAFQLTVLQRPLETFTGDKSPMASNAIGTSSPPPRWTGSLARQAGRVHWILAPPSLDRPFRPHQVRPFTLESQLRRSNHKTTNYCAQTPSDTWTTLTLNDCVSKHQ